MKYSNPMKKLGLIFTPIYLMIGISLIIAGAVAFIYLGIITQDIDLEYFLYIATLPLLGGFLVWFTYSHLLKRTYSYIVISSEGVSWNCPLFKSINLSKEDCVYVGIADEEKAHPKPIFGRHYIYLSVLPLEEKYRHRIGEVSCKNGFICFPYTDALCLNLIEILPEEKTPVLKGFYNQMQDRKRLREREEAARKRRKEKEKQRKKK